MINAHTDRHDKANKEIFKLHEPGKCLMLTLIPYTIPYSGFQYCNHHKQTLRMTDYQIRHLWCNTSCAGQKLSISEYFQSALP
jgi:hypothetical protein